MFLKIFKYKFGSIFIKIVFYAEIYLFLSKNFAILRTPIVCISVRIFYFYFRVLCISCILLIIFRVFTDY